MEFTLVVSFKLLLLLFLFSIASRPILSIDFAVGCDGDWLIPSSNDPNFYNNWASKNRFMVNDTISFKYNNDSVLVVTLTDYIQCQSIHPIFYFENGNTEFKFERAGFFYFISGISWKCVRGERMIINVTADPEASPPDGRNNSNSSNSTISPALGNSSDSTISSAPSSSSLSIFSLSVGILAFFLGLINQKILGLTALVQ